MKKIRIVTLLLALLSLTTPQLAAQPGGGMGGPGAMSQVDPLAMMGLFEIDSESVIKRIKVTDTEKQRAIREAVADYIIAYGDVVAANGETIDLFEEYKAQMSDGAGQVAPDRENMYAMREGSRTIHLAMTKLHNKLDSSIKACLEGDEKALKKWQSHYKWLCDKNYYNPNFQRAQHGGRPGQNGGGAHGGHRGKPMAE